VRILICSIMPAKTYSGGRYHAWMLAQAFATLGHSVTFWTNNEPIFVGDFADYEHKDRVELRLTTDFSETPEGPWDFVWIIPHKHPPVKIFRRALEVARLSNAKLGMLSFETPNWIAKTAAHGADPKPWQAWEVIGPHLDVILSSTAVGEEHAREFFAGADARYYNITPPVNDLVADQAGMDAGGHSGRNSVICITRFGGQFGYKGGMEVLEHTGPALNGSKLTFIVGTASVAASDLKAYADWGREHDVEIAFEHRVTDFEKFRLLLNADLMLFLSRFEGFGYPPVEALYCNTPCIAYDLPVLREVSGEKLIYADMDNPDTLGPAISEVLANLSAHKARLAALDHSWLGFAAFAEKVSALLAAEAAYAPKAAQMPELRVTETKQALRAIDAASGRRKKSVPAKRPGLKVRLRRGFVRGLAGMFRRVPVLRNLFGQAILSHHNLSLLLEDRTMTRLLFENRKALTLRIRQNPEFLKHLMLSPQAIEMLPEILARLEAKAAEETAKRTLDAQTPSS